jgi:hypothetical protein
MKRNYRLSAVTSILLLAVMAVSCVQVDELYDDGQGTLQDEEILGDGASQEGEGVLVPMTFSITDTKSYLDGKKVIFEEGESLAVYDGFGVREFTMVSLENLTFKGEISSNSTYQWAVYPYMEEGISGTEASISVPLPASQKLSDKNTAKGTLISAGKINNGFVLLKNLTSVVSVEITKPDIASILVEGPALAGAATFDADGKLLSVAEGAGASTSLVPASGVFAAGTYNVPVLPGLSAADLKVSVVRKDGYKGTKVVEDIQMERNIIYSAGQLDKNVPEWVYEVPDAAALLAWHSGHNGTWKTNMSTNYSGAHNKVLLTGDVDLGGVKNKWAYKNLYCEFDGNGHKIYNMVIEREAHVHFFEELEADIHDVTFGSKDGSTYDGVSKIVSTYKTGDNVWQYIGLFQRVTSSGVTLENIVSYVPVTVPADANGKFRVGGLICLGTTGQDRTTTITSCKTYGKVSVLHTGIIKDENDNIQVNYISGMVGLMDGTADHTNTLVLTNCENHADMDVRNPSVEALGGIFGYRFSKQYMYLTINGCKNYGNITYSCDTDGFRCAIGGVVGKIVENSTIKDAQGKFYVNITDCENGKSGVESTVSSKGKYYCVGGVAGWISGVSMTGCKNYGTVYGEDMVKIEDKYYSNVVGGIAGNVSHVASNDVYANSNKVTVLNGCRNEGAVTGIFNTLSTGGNNGLSGAAVGGIVGSVRSIKSFKNNDNVGSVYGVNKYASKYVFVGGIAGHAHCVNDPDSFYGCRNAGTVKAGGSSSSAKINVGVGGIVGKLMAHIYSCANYGAVVSENVSTNNAASVVGMTRGIKNNSAPHPTISGCVSSGTVNGTAPSSSKQMVCANGSPVVSETTVGGSRPSDL